jgi:enterochelin esterase-like enzyme
MKGFLPATMCLLMFASCGGAEPGETPEPMVSGTGGIPPIYEENDDYQPEIIEEEEIFMTIDLAALREELNTDPTPSPGFGAMQEGLELGELVTLEYFSVTTGNTRRVNVFTPPGFDPDNNTYPVLYLLHGIGGTHTEWLGGNPNQVLSNLIASGNAVPMIAVMPNVRARYNDSASGDHFSAENVAAFDNFINDLRYDLMPFIEVNFPVTHARHETAIAGLSMGGRAALQIGALMPEYFMFIASFSSAPGLLRPEGGTTGVLYAHELTIPEDLRDNTFILLNNGDNEEMFANMTMMYYNAFVENGVNPVHYVTPGGHDFSVWMNGLYHFARNIF